VALIALYAVGLIYTLRTRRAPFSTEEEREAPRWSTRRSVASAATTSTRIPSKVRGATDRRLLTDLVSLVRYALKQDETLIPFPDRVKDRFEAWLTHQQANGATFTPDQIQWLESIRDHVATSASITPDDLDLPPFTSHGGLARAYNLFGENLAPLLEELNEVLAA